MSLPVTLEFLRVVLLGLCVNAEAAADFAALLE